MSMMELKASTALSRTEVMSWVSRSASVEATVTSAMLALPVAAWSDRFVADCCDASRESSAFPRTSENDVGAVPDDAGAVVLAAGRGRRGLRRSSADGRADARDGRNGRDHAQALMLRIDW